MRDYPQHDDLGLVDDDATEDLRPKKNAPAGAPTPAGGDENHSPVTTDKELQMKMIDQPTDVALPPGAAPASSDDWEPGVTVWRCVWSPPLGPDGSDVRCVVIQHLDGTIATDGDDGPLVYVGADDYSCADARALADAIIRAADLADTWAGVAR